MVDDGPHWQVHNQHYHESISWLAIALTPAESEALRAEPVVWQPAGCTRDIVPVDPMCQCNRTV
jgi:hypothetical protein